MSKMKLRESIIIIIIIIVVYVALSFAISLPAVAFAQVQSKIQNSTTISQANNGTVIDYTCDSACVINYTDISVHCPPYPITGTNCHLVNDGTPHPQFYDNCTLFLGHPQTNNYYNGYINGSQEGLDQGFNAIDDPSDYCTNPPDPHNNWCKGWWQGWEDSWQFGCSHGGRKYFPTGDC
jgi:hypothetical protein